MKFNIDFSFIIAILILIQLFLLSLNVGSKSVENSDEGEKTENEDIYQGVDNNAYIIENEVNSKGNEIKEKMLVWKKD